jgi:hypothetical protein
MHGFFQIERHHMRAALGDFVQPLLARSAAKTGVVINQANQPSTIKLLFISFSFIQR